MGSEQSTPSTKPSEEPQLVLQSPTATLLREGALSPRQGSVCSDSDVPFVSYTVDKPIGDSPKKTQKPTKSKFSSPRLSRAHARLAKSSANTLVTVNKLKVSDEVRCDPDLIKLQEIPVFLPIMTGSLSAGKGQENADILSRLDPGPLNSILQQYQDHLRNCAARVAADQGGIARQMRDVESDVISISNNLQDRQRKYEKHCEKLKTVRDISRSLAKCHMLLNENIDMMDALNSSLPQDLRLEPFVWTTG